MSGVHSQEEEKDIKEWMLPEFGLFAKVNHTGQKKLKVKPIIHKPVIDHQKQQEEYQQEYKEGYEAGLQKAQCELEEKQKMIAHLLSELTKNNQEIMQSWVEKIKRQSVDFIQLACERIIHHQLSVEPQAMLAMIQRALERVQAQTAVVKIYCHDDLFLLLGGEKNAEDNPNVSIEKDNRLGDFGFRIESDKQFLSFDLKQSIEKLFEEYLHITGMSS